MLNSVHLNICLIITYLNILSKDIQNLKNRTNNKFKKLKNYDKCDQHTKVISII